MKRVLMVLVMLGIAGCATVTPENVGQIEDLKLCGLYAFKKGDPVIRGELLRRGIITEEELHSADEKKIFRGMSECGLLASWSDPSWKQGTYNLVYCGTVNRSMGSWGVHKQYVYRRCGRSYSASYVYVENGRVTSWQQ